MIRTLLDMVSSPFVFSYKIKWLSARLVWVSGIIVCFDDLLDQTVAHYIFFRKIALGNAAYTPLTPAEHPQGRFGYGLAGRSGVTSPVTTTLEPTPIRVKNIFICSGVVFCASSEDDKRVIQRTSPLYTPRSYFDDLFFLPGAHGLRPQQIKQSIMQRAQIKDPPSAEDHPAESPVFHQLPPQGGSG